MVGFQEIKYLRFLFQRSAIFDTQTFDFYLEYRSQKVSINTKIGIFKFQRHQVCYYIVGIRILDKSGFQRIKMCPIFERFGF